MLHANTAFIDRHINPIRNSAPSNWDIKAGYQGLPTTPLAQHDDVAVAARQGLCTKSVYGLGYESDQSGASRR
jgi:hypothetical protein